MVRSITVLLFLSTVALAQPLPSGGPPGQIVISPKKPAEPIQPASATGGTVFKGQDPDRPQFIVIFPNAAAMKGAVPITSMLAMPKPASSVQTDNGIPTITIIGKGEPNKPSTPSMLPQPTPVSGAKPPVAPAPAPVEKVEDGKLLIDTYDVAYCRGCKVGYMQTVVREYLRNDKKVIYGVRKLTLQLKRFGEIVELWSEESSLENEDGTVISTNLRQGLGKNQMMELAGKVTDKGLEVAIRNAKNEQKETIPWPAGVVGVGREASILREMKPKPGLSIEYQTYFGQFNGVITYKLMSKGVEEVTLDGAKPRKLLKVLQDMKPVGEFKLPTATVYLDPETYEPVAMETQNPILGGIMTAKRTTREVALAKPARYLDIGEVQSIVLPKSAPGLHTADKATYSIQFEGEIDPEKALPSDGRQTLKLIDAKTRKVELAVTAVRVPSKPDVVLTAPGKEYLSDSYFIDWNNDLVKKHAAEAVRGLPANASAWDKAKAVETWVHRNIKQVEFSQAMASCSTVAKELSGDCTEHAMLATGMCRALGIPSRTALGLVYFEKNANTALLAYHMWYEVWTDGGWMALDAIQGAGSVGPGHIKITDSHWDGEKGFTPLLPVLGILAAQPKVNVARP
jgi:transglutaminase-like putative cysteine protease